MVAPVTVKLPAVIAPVEAMLAALNDPAVNVPPIVALPVVEMVAKLPLVAAMVVAETVFVAFTLVALTVAMLPTAAFTVEVVTVEALTMLILPAAAVTVPVTFTAPKLPAVALTVEALTMLMLPVAAVTVDALTVEPVRLPATFPARLPLNVVAVIGPVVERLVAVRAPVVTVPNVVAPVTDNVPPTARFPPGEAVVAETTFEATTVVLVL